jgi:ArsR family transcriptional regulator, cadmium/lead-responsive transcriptional repressor
VNDFGPVFAALADPNRRLLLDLLAARGSGTATELAHELPVSRQAVSKHLTTLSGAGLVTRARAGREARYRVQPEPLLAAAAWMTETGSAWEIRLSRLERFLARQTAP